MRRHVHRNHLTSRSSFLLNKDEHTRLATAKRNSLLLHRLRTCFGYSNSTTTTTTTTTAATWGAIAILLAAFAILTVAFYAAIQRHDVELSFDQLAAFERHVHTFGNHTVYVLDPSNDDLVFYTLPHEDWTKVSSKIDYLAFLYEEVDTVATRSQHHIVHFAAIALEQIRPHGYGLALFSCGCLVHNVLFQHVSTRFGGAECAMLPGFVLEQDAVRWVSIPDASKDDCSAARDAIFAKPWYTANAWKLEQVRSEYAAAKEHLTQIEHPDRPSPTPNGLQKS